MHGCLCHVFFYVVDGRTCCAHKWWLFCYDEMGWEYGVGTGMEMEMLNTWIVRCGCINGSNELPARLVE